VIQREVYRLQSERARGKDSWTGTLELSILSKAKFDNDHSHKATKQACYEESDWVKLTTISIIGEFSRNAGQMWGH